MKMGPKKEAGKMDLHSRKEYLMKLREEYLGADKKKKTALLDEYTRNTAHNRKYVISRLNNENVWSGITCLRHPRKRIYGPEIDAPLKTLWQIFDYPCGQRLKPCIEEELERLRQFGEIEVSNEVTQKLLKIGSATIDRHLKVTRSAEHRRRFSTTRPVIQIIAEAGSDKDAKKLISDYVEKIDTRR